jgi:hypothetical protein
MAQAGLRIAAPSLRSWCRREDRHQFLARALAHCGAKLRRALSRSIGRDIRAAGGYMTGFWASFWSQVVQSFAFGVGAVPPGIVLVTIQAAKV